jgi:peptidyl-tRNA hydrolase, PTH1 family
MKLIVGLGNPGMGYSANRHNIGFICLNHFARLHKIAFDKKQGKARVGIGDISGQKVVLARPQTFMNASGQAVSFLMQKYSLSLDDLMVVHDDLDLPVGKIRIRKGSSAGGHKGVESIIACLGSKDFIRIRVGIGRPSPPDQTRGEEIIDFVLGDFSKEEEKVMDETISRVSDAIHSLLTEDTSSAMNKFN